MSVEDFPPLRPSVTDPTSPSWGPLRSRISSDSLVEVLPVSVPEGKPNRKMALPRASPLPKGRGSRSRSGDGIGRKGFRRISPVKSSSVWKDEWPGWVTRGEILRYRSPLETPVLQDRESGVRVYECVKPT